MRKYNEIFKLKKMLEEANIPFEFNEMHAGYHIEYPTFSPKRVCSVIEHALSLGEEEDLLEIMGLLTTAEKRMENEVKGYLTAEDVFERIQTHYREQKQEKEKEEKKAFIKGVAQVDWMVDGLTKDLLNITPSQSIKADAGKERISLVPMQIVRDIAVVREYGNKKYPANSWRGVKAGRYIDALGRHALAFLENPTGRDEESGLPHLWHLECNAAFLSEMMKEEFKEQDNG